MTLADRYRAAMMATPAGRCAVKIHRAIEHNVQRWYADTIDYATFTVRQVRLWDAAVACAVVDQVTDLCRASLPDAHALP